MKINRIDIKGEVYDIEAYENPIPTGSIFPFAGIAEPEGFLLCNGQEVSRFTYAKLYGVLGDTYGAGDGSTTFNLPDFRDRVAQGANNNLGETKEAGLPNITGSFSSAINAYRTASVNAKGAFSGTRGATDANATGTNAVTDTSIMLDASKVSAIYGNSDTVQPKAICTNFIIKV